jgi:Na+/H+ antiporter NhaD/arsenite permease-like protein
LLRFFFRKDIVVQKEVADRNTNNNNLVNELLQIDQTSPIKDKDTLKKSMIVLVGVIALFSLQKIHHLEVSVIALGGCCGITCNNKVTFRKNTA